ncbi:MAG TPA: C_GCAxxG_C_C family protein [Dehalococcoidia bacterium]|nr:C_GCAxxG_C_C family protein [Dehalococcoidia bacterium]
MVEIKRTKEEIINKAEELGVEYEAKYKGCGQCTFLAIIDALRWGGLELIPEDMEDRLFSGICVMTAGVAMTGEGTCGAVNSAVLAIGLALGISRESQDDRVMRDGCVTIRNTILDKYYKEYSSILCKDVQRKFFGRAWDLTRDDMSQEFLGITEGCTIMQTARWSTEIILDEFEKGNLNLPV